MTSPPRPRPAPSGRRPQRHERGSAVRRAVGPLGKPIYTDGAAVKTETGYQFDADANALILLRRVAFTGDDGDIDKAGQRALLRWAAERRLGPSPRLVAEAAKRRARALAAVAEAGDAVVR